MGIYISNMEMPKDCGHCRFAVDGWCYAYGKPNIPALAQSEVSNFCPLIPLPEEHGRLGDLDKINASLEAMIEIEHNQNAAPYSWSHAYTEMQSILDEAPTIVPAEGGKEE